VGGGFSAPVQTGPGLHPVSYTMGTGSFPGVKRPGRGVDHLPLSSAEVKERYELVDDHFSIIFIRFAGASYGRSVNICSGTVSDR
jgi:hypothetical protein